MNKHSNGQAANYLQKKWNNNISFRAEVIAKNWIICKVKSSPLTERRRKTKIKTHHQTGSPKTTEPIRCGHLWGEWVVRVLLHCCCVGSNCYCRWCFIFFSFFCWNILHSPLLKIMGKPANKLQLNVKMILEILGCTNGGNLFNNNRNAYYIIKMHRIKVD